MNTEARGAEAEAGPGGKPAVKNGANEIPARSGASIRARLAIMLALFALVPSLVVTFLASRRIAESLELMQSPGVARTVEGAFDITRTSTGRLEGALHSACVAAAGEPEVTGRPTGRTATDTLRLAPLLDRHSVDFASLYARGPAGGWRLEGEVIRRAGDSVAATDAARLRYMARAPRPELPRPLAPGVHYDPGGWLIEAVPARSADPETSIILALAYYMGPAFFQQLQDVGTGVGYYRKLDVLKGLYVGSIWVWAAFILLAVAVATLLTARRAAESLSRPLVDLAEGMRKVARGEEGVIVRPKGSSETRFLAGTFNSMVEQLAAYKRELALAERAAAWQDIARIVAHEIRNPLTPIQFAIRRIRDRTKNLPDAEREPLRESLDSILGEVETLKALASSFSQFAKLPEPSPSEMDINRLASEVVDLFGGEKSAGFVLDLGEGLPKVCADKGQMRMVLNNLLKNSLEAMTGGGAITVSTRLEHDRGRSWIVLEVRDTGAGMDAETLAKATDAYFSTKTRGSGLGLAVVHKIVSQHGGAFVIRSSPGAGSTVAVRLPAAKT